MANFSPRQIPIIGNDIYQVGQLYEIISQPCGPDPWIYAKGFFAYTPQLVWTLVKPEQKDVISERFGRPHKRKRKRRFHIAKIDPVGKGAGAGVRQVLWRGFKASERIGWYLSVVDATTDFLVNWHSMAYTFSGCQVPGSSTAQAYGSYGFMGQTLSSLSLVVPGTDNWEQGNAFAGNTEVSINDVGPKFFGGSAALRLEPFLGQLGEIERVYLRVRYFGGATREYDLERQEGTASNGVWTGTNINYDVTAPGADARLRVTWNGGRLFSDSMMLSAMNAPPGGSPPDGLLPDP